MTKIEHKSVIKNLVMVQLSLGSIPGSRIDKEKTNKLAGELGVHPLSISVRLQKLPKVWTSKVTQEISSLRMGFKDLTQPWEDGSWRIVSTSNYQKLVDFVDDKTIKINQIRDDIVSNWNLVKKDTQAMLGPQFSEEMFPTAEFFKNSIYVKFRTGGVPAPEDTRIEGLSKTVVDRIIEERTRETKEKIRNAAQYSVTKLVDIVNALSEKLSEEDQKGKKYKRIMEKLHEATDLTAINILNDPKLAEVVTEARAKLLKLEADDVKEHDFVREGLKAQADGVAEKLMNIRF